MRILFMGCVKSSEILLQALLEQKFSVAAVITKKQSDFNADFCSMDKICIEHNIDFLYSDNVSKQEMMQFVQSQQADVIYCFGWSQLIHEDIINIPQYGAVGFHPAALPYNRGRHPLIWALVLGLKKTASTFFMMDAGADTGDIISQEEVEISDFDDADSLYKKVMEKAKLQVVKFTKELQEGTLVRIKQDVSQGNTWRKRGMRDGEIDWRMSGRAIYNLIRALAKPYPGAHFMYGDKIVKVWKAEEVSGTKYCNIEPGKVLKVNSETDYFVKAYDSVIHILDSDAVCIKEGEYI